MGKYNVFYFLFRNEKKVRTQLFQIDITKGSMQQLRPISIKINETVQGKIACISMNFKRDTAGKIIDEQ